GVFRLTADIDAAIEFRCRARHDLLEGCSRYIAVDAGDEKPGALVLLKQPVGGADAVRSACQHHNAIGSRHLGWRCGIKRCGEDEEACDVENHAQGRKPGNGTGDALPYSLLQPCRRRHYRPSPLAAPGLCPDPCRMIGGALAKSKHLREGAPAC